MIKKILYRPFFIRLFNWEFWPFHVVYGPIYLYWLFLCLKARSFFFFNTSNPGIRNGGFLMESKWDIYRLMADKHYPATIFIPGGTKKEELLNKLKDSGIKYPLIGKPDIGMKGMAVNKLHSEEELLNYAKGSVVDFLIQEFVPYNNEVGIFYYRLPGEEKGKISGIVRKELLCVTGDGKTSIDSLLQKDKRHKLQLKKLRQTLGDRLAEIPDAGQELILVPYGNHVRGAKFIDISSESDDALSAVIDNVCKGINGFYYGRMDLRYESWEELKKGRNFSIIELNGAGSEPTHIYDPSHSIFFAWKEIIRHWNILYKISKLNHQSGKHPYMSSQEGITMLKESSRYLKLIQ